MPEGPARSQPPMCLASAGPLGTISVTLQTWHDHYPHSTGGETEARLGKQPHSPTTRSAGPKPRQACPSAHAAPPQRRSRAALKNVSGPGRGCGWEKGSAHWWQEPVEPTDTHSTAHNEAVAPQLPGRLQGLGSGRETRLLTGRERECQETAHGTAPRAATSPPGPCWALSTERGRTTRPVRRGRHRE